MIYGPYDDGVEVSVVIGVDSFADPRQDHERILTPHFSARLVVLIFVVLETHN